MAAATAAPPWASLGPDNGILVCPAYADHFFVNNFSIVLKKSTCGGQDSPRVLY
jgi:hypothetical protein